MFFFFIFLIFAQNIDCGYTLEPPRRGGFNEYPPSMFWSKNKKNRYTPLYPSFANIKLGYKGVFITGLIFLMKAPYFSYCFVITVFIAFHWVI